MSKQYQKSKVSAERRPHCSETEQIALVSQVNRHCPLCGVKLFRNKNGEEYKFYEVAHIYPHSPTPKELVVLESVTVPEKIDDEKNYIALCPNCHTEYDKGKTLEEYNRLRSVKDGLIAKEIQYDLQYEYKLKEDINSIVAKLESACTKKDGLVPLSYDPKKVDKKLKDSISPFQLRNIKALVTQYYRLIAKSFAEIEKRTGNAKIIASNIRTYYLEQKRLPIDNQKIYNNMVDWVLHNTKTDNRDAAAVIVAYFIQHCEVFE